jgi:hypothetical protein
LSRNPVGPERHRLGDGELGMCHYHPRQEWRQVYAAALRARTGKWALDSYDLAAFGPGLAPHIAGARAENAFAQLDCGTFFVWTGNDDSLVLKCQRLTPHDLSRFADVYKYGSVTRSGNDVDVYLCGEALEWTMVYAHVQEIHVGPVFSRKDWQPAPGGGRRNTRRGRWPGGAGG